jgi:hypothetical protein
VISESRSKPRAPLLAAKDKQTHNTLRARFKPGPGGTGLYCTLFCNFLYFFTKNRKKV